MGEPMLPTSEARIFELLLMAKPGADPIHGIRALLKLALRRYGLRCVQAREIAPPLKPERTQADDLLARQTNL